MLEAAGIIGLPDAFRGNARMYNITRSTMELEKEQIIEYFRRSYTAADGLWFVKAEEKYGFDAALELDRAVWRVLPKIQARMLKHMGRPGRSLEALRECLEIKLTLEGFRFRIEGIENTSGFRLVVTECPWYNLLLKSGRENIAAAVGDAICDTEYPVWAAEFGEEISFEMKSQICQGARNCILKFTL